MAGSLRVKAKSSLVHDKRSDEDACRRVSKAGGPKPSYDVESRGDLVLCVAGWATSCIEL